jgi:membrane protein implicated in regulation of membrane protease activity
MQIKNKTMLSVGLLSLALSILIGKFTFISYGNIIVSDFLSGFFVGLSIVMMLAYAVRLRMKTVPLNSTL